MAYTLKYTTLTKVRRLAGFPENYDIDDDRDINPAAIFAESMYDSIISFRYSLPLSDGTYYTDSQAEALSEQLVTSLAAAYLQKNQYQGQGDVMEEGAIAWFERLLEEIKEIGEGKKQLIGSDSNELDTKSSGKTSLTGYPITDEDSDDNDISSKFTMYETF